MQECTDANLGDSIDIAAHPMKTTMTDAPDCSSSATPSAVSQRSRSVLDYSSEPALKAALASGLHIRDDESMASSAAEVSKDDDDCDWKLDNIYKEDYYEQDLEREMKRLMVLKSYQLLDLEDAELRGQAFDRLTSLAARIFDMPTAIISLVDLGRCWILSGHGTTLKEAKRKQAFCSHSVLYKHGVLVVPDATKDDRFCENPFVSQSGVRFYAGAPLVSPEGYTLGSFCFFDTKLRPDFTEAQRESLKDFAQLSVDAFVQHRTVQQQRSQLNTASRKLASASHDLLTPLSGLQLSLSLLNQDADLQEKLLDHQKEYLATITSCSSSMSGVCQALRLKHEEERLDLLNQVVMESSQLSGSLDSDGEGSSDLICHIPTLVENLQEALEAFPKQVPLSIAVDPAVPMSVLLSEAKIFRIVLRIMAHSCERTVNGSVCMKIRVNESGSCCKELLFECRDTGPIIKPSAGRDEAASNAADFNLASPRSEEDSTSTDDSKPMEVECLNGRCFPVQNQDRLELVPQEVRSLGGDFGVSTLDNGQEPTTCFWLTVPLFLPEDAKPADGKRTLLTDSDETPPAKVQRTSPKRALVIDDSVVVRRMLARALSKLGYETLQAIDGMIGMKLMQESKFDVVLVDFLMPVMDGLDCVREYRRWESKHRPGFQQYIVGMSAHASSKDVDRGLSLGMNTFRPKPVTMDTLKNLEISYRALSLPETPPTLKRRLSYARSNSMSSIWAVEQDGGKVCLVVTAEADIFERIDAVAGARGWKAVRVSDGNEALTLLKRRNWGAVMIDSHVPGLSAVSCISKFRQWEQKNRVLRQKNLTLLSSGFNSPWHKGSMSFVQLPTGVDGAMNKSAAKFDLECTFQSFESRQQHSFDERDIVTR